MLKRRKWIRFGDSILVDRGFYACKNYLIWIRYGIEPLILSKKYFRYNRFKRLISYHLK